MTKSADFAIVVRAPGGPEALEWTELETTAPARGEVLIAQRAVGVNFIDTYYRKGHYPWPMSPLIPGGEAAGIVEAVGEGVTDFKPGDRVAYTLPIGAYRTRRVVPAERLVKLPEGIDFDVAASMMLKGLTAQFLLNSCYAVKASDTGAGARGRGRRGAVDGSMAEVHRRDFHRHGGFRRKSRHRQSQRLHACHRLSGRGFPGARQGDHRRQGLRCGLRFRRQRHVARVAEMPACARIVCLLRTVLRTDHRFQIFRSRRRRLAIRDAADAVRLHQNPRGSHPARAPIYSRKSHPAR